MQYLYSSGAVLQASSTSSLFYNTDYSLNVMDGREWRMTVKVKLYYIYSYIFYVKAQ